MNGATGFASGALTGAGAQVVDLVAIAPPLVLAVVAVVVLLLDAPLLDSPAPRRDGATGATGGPRVAVLRRVRLLEAGALLGVGAALLAQAWLAVGVWGGQPRATFCLPGGGPLSCSYVVDSFTVLIGFVVLAAGAAALLLALPEIRDTRLPRGEFLFLLLVVLAGATALPAARDLATLVVSLELISLPLFALVALRRYDGRASESALTMFLVSVASTAVMLFGVSLIYGLAGSLHLDRIAAALDPATAPPAVSAAIMLVLVGFAFKISAVPFHAWAPDTYAGAPIAVAAVLAVVSKVAGFAGLILVLVVAFGSFASVWGPAVAVLAAVSMSAGNLVALRQRSALRLLAWSSIAQAGYVLAPLGALAGVVDPGTRDVLLAAAVGYLVIYAAMTTGAFAVAAFVGRTAEGGDGTDLDDYRGLARDHPAVGVAFAFFLACLAGLPPGLAGLFAKVVVVQAVITGGYGWLAVLVVLNTAIGLYYYLAWAARVFAPRAGPREGTAAAPLPRSVGVAIGASAAAVVGLSVAPQLVFGGWALAGLG